MNYSKRAYNASRIIKSIDDAVNSDANKEWRLVFSIREASSDKFNYVILNV